AVQKIRDAAGRSQCSNNLHQIGVALAAYQNDNGQLPPGCTTDNNGFGLGGGWGSSWMVFLLPYVEQGNMFSLWDFGTSNPPWFTTPVGSSGYTNLHNRAITTGGTIGPPPAAAATGTVNGTSPVMINTYRCPTTALPKNMLSTNSGLQIMQSNYVGIAGAANSCFVVNGVQTWS